MLVIAVFLASAVEMVEALTIVLAVGATRGWRSAIEGVVAALAVLTVIVIAFGPALVDYVPIDLLRSVVGGVLLIFGLQWMRKAVLRASGIREKRNEDLVYGKTVNQLASSRTARGRDGQGFAVAFKGVFIEGLEVVIIVLTLGSSAHDLGLAAGSALAAVAVVAAVGLVISKQLSGIPENLMKLMVGVMLVSFGTFWGGEGLGLSWPGNDVMIPVLVAIYGLITWALVRFLAGQYRKLQSRVPDAGSAVRQKVIPSQSDQDLPTRPLVVKLAMGFLRFWWDFLIGETPEVFVGTVMIFIIIELLLHSGVPLAVTTAAGPVMVLILLNATVYKAYTAET